MGTSSLIGLDAGEPRGNGEARPSNVGSALLVLATLLLATGGALLAYYTAAQVDAVRGRAAALAEFAEARSEADALVADTGVSVGPFDYPSDPDQSLWGKARIAAYRDSSSVHRDAAIGVITIPSVDLEAPIFEGTSDVALNRGIGRIQGTADIGAAGNVGLAGHRDGFFRALKDVKVGDAVDVESLAGTTRFRITELMIVEPTDVYVLDATDGPTLTLVTCYPFYFVGAAPQRYIVRAVAENPRARATL